jgi:hypothetical protein
MFRAWSLFTNSPNCVAPVSISTRFRFLDFRVSDFTSSALRTLTPRKATGLFRDMGLNHELGVAPHPTAKRTHSKRDIASFTPSRCFCLFISS